MEGRLTGSGFRIEHFEKKLVNIDGRIEQIYRHKVAELERHFMLLEKKVVSMEDQIERMYKNIDYKVAEVERHLEGSLKKIESKIEELNKSVHNTSIRLGIIQEKLLEQEEKLLQEVKKMEEEIEKKAEDEGFRLYTMFGIEDMLELTGKNNYFNRYFNDDEEPKGQNKCI